MTTHRAATGEASPLAIADVSYQYPRFELGPVTFEVRAGEILGLVGPNGSGKTTLLEVIVGRRQPAKGTVRIAGDRDPVEPETRRLLGYGADSTEELISELTAVEFWRIHALAQAGRDGRARCNERAVAVAASLEFDPPAQPISTYSHGMKKKTQIVASCLHEPLVVVLDEPTNGLDPLTSYRLGAHVDALAARGSACLMATHDLAWAQRFCHRIAAISNGRIVAIGDVDEIFPTGRPLLDRFMAVVEGELL
ncbi:MAG: ABC transporter ATP-binding protein [bacterium]|nr:ABC transporter ATP-binding protein [Actinomycetes bacterium]MCP4967454.1 ABC transporter ATP-binding protein [bacterium]